MRLFYPTVLFLSLFAFVSLTACSNDDGGGGITPPKYQPFKIDASLKPLSVGENPVFSRAMASEDGTVLSWENSDQFGLYHVTVSGSSSTKAILNFDYIESNGTGGGIFQSEAKLEIDMSASNNVFYGLSPYSSTAGTDISAVNVTVPTVQNQKNNGRNIAENGLLVGRGNTFEDTEIVKMEFESVLATFRITIDATDSAAEGTTIENFTFTAAEPIAGACKLNLETGALSGLSTRTIEVNFDQPQQMDGKDVYLVHFAPTIDIESELEFRFSNDLFDFVITGVTSYMEQIIAGTVYDFEWNLQKLIDDNNLTINYKGEKYADDNSSNCYMIQPGSSLNIPVARAWHVWSTYLGTDLHGELTAELLWQDEKSMVKSVTLPSGDQGRNSIIAVETNSGVEGNAVVAIRLNGKIVYSWHLWVTSYVPDNSLTSFNGVESFTFMDRNLGAKSNVPGEVKSNGYLYQWGRKDPFPPSDILDQSTLSTEVSQTISIPHYDIDNNPLIEESSEADNIVLSVIITSHQNLKHALNNPCTFYSNYYVINNGDWYTMNYPDQNEYLWRTEDGKKAVFDPCPVGWKVPHFSKTVINGSESYISPWTVVDPDTGSFKWMPAEPTAETYIGASGSTQYYWGQGLMTELGYYPSQGFRDNYGELFNVGNVAYYWASNTLQAELKGVDGYMVGYTMATVVWHNSFSMGDGAPHTPGRCHGMSIRCVKDN